MAPPKSAGSARAWAWAQTLARATAPGEFLLTLTARGPLLAKRHIVVVHDLLILTNPEWFSRKFVVTHAPILRSQIASSVALVAVSEPVAAQLRELTGSAKPITVAPNAPSDVFTASVPDSDDEVLRRHGLTRGSYFLAVGSLDPRKNLSVLSEAYRLLPADLRTDWPLVIVGGTNANVFGASDLSSAPWMKPVGYVDDEVLAALYRGACRVLFPTLAEGFGLPLVEALASGAEVLASDIEILRWVGGELPEFIDPRDPSRWSSAIHAAIHRAAVQEHRGAAERLIRERFSWSTSAELLYRFIGELS